MPPRESVVYLSKEKAGFILWICMSRYAKAFVNFCTPVEELPACLEGLAVLKTVINERIKYLKPR